ncbi:hypothetical protein [Halopseudomonas salegens]|uniref:Uncharacterized protein n=1 Tax=Halopseudomonas salegens TaxID=1434072 RepID=A0A1H2FEJ2_9GAMM|nr:hypothetical protein [Halopseudomonas salegens]SDU05781.1 hypothetical protein SAMN05216210_1498 [Halopseudomonas salegens]
MAVSVINDLNTLQQLAPEDSEPVFMLAVVSVLGQKEAQKLDQSLLPELLLQVDDLALRQGAKNQMLDA